MFVQSYMTPNPVTLAEHDPVSKAEELMRSHHVRQFPVTDVADAFSALQSYDREIVGAVVGRMRRDGDEPSLYLKVTDPDGHRVEEHLRRAGLIVLVPEHR